MSEAKPHLAVHVKAIRFGTSSYASDLPQRKKPARAVAALPTSLMGRSLNGLASVVAIGLCAWAVSYGTALLMERRRPSDMHITEGQLALPFGLAQRGIEDPQVEELDTL